MFMMVLQKKNYNKSLKQHYGSVGVHHASDNNTISAVVLVIVIIVVILVPIIVLVLVTILILVLLLVLVIQIILVFL